MMVRAIIAALGVAVAACSGPPDAHMDGPDMVLIPAGTFTMGRDDGEKGRYEGPPHSVDIKKPFWLAATEVTHGQFAAFVEATGYQQAIGCKVWPTGTLAFEEASWRSPGYETRADYPAACISWTDAQAYIAWLSQQTGAQYRLPTEAEWEYAASAGSDGAYPWGDDVEAGCTYANWYDASAKGTFRWAHSACSDGHKGPSPVASYPANAFGVFDMVGNVWEWTQDCYIVPYGPDHVDARAVEVEGPCDRRGVRGGSWMTRPDRNTVHFRGRDPEDTRYFMFGFRLARSLTDDERTELAP